MENPGYGSKFVSVNLNKSYGKPKGSSRGVGFGLEQARSVIPGSSGMVVFSRQRSSISTGTKSNSRLSVPPPLNLPSLRKESERLDQISSSSGRLPGSANSKSIPGSTSIGWTKSVIPLAEKDGHDNSSFHLGNDEAKNRGVYVPPGARSSVSAHPGEVPNRNSLSREKAVLLRGEDFPSLQVATSFSCHSGPSHKNKSALDQKPRLIETGSNDHTRTPPNVDLPVQTRTQHVGSSHLYLAHVSGKNKDLSNNDLGFHTKEKLRKKDDSNDPLPVVKLSHTVDWDDDERDKGHTYMKKDQNRVPLSTNDQERDFHIPKIGLSHLSVDGFKSDFDKIQNLKSDMYIRDMSTSNNDWNSWRAPNHLVGAQEIGNGRNSHSARHSDGTKEANKRASHMQSSYGGHTTGATLNKNQDYVREMVNGKGIEMNASRHYGDFSVKSRSEKFQNNSPTNSSSILNFNRERHLLFSNERSYSKDGLTKAFGRSSSIHGNDLLSGDMKVFKRKKDAQNQANFHDPIRESFEAELERVQKAQEQERQRIIKDQERAMEIARKEAEERERLAREEGERKRRLEEEAREAAWREEQEKVEAQKRVQAQKLAREEEKKKIHLEEERRKEAARQMLLELEAKMARRQADGIKYEKLSTGAHDERAPNMDNENKFQHWEENDHVIEKLPSSASYHVRKSSEIDPGPHSHRDLSRERLANSWKHYGDGNSSDSIFFDNEKDKNHHSTDNMSSRIEFYGTRHPAYTSQMLHDFSNSRGLKSEYHGDGDHFNRISDLDNEFSKVSIDDLGDTEWGQGRLPLHTHAPCSEKFFQNPETDEFPSYGRSRIHVKQPRVLPPPSTYLYKSPPIASEPSRSLEFPDHEKKCHTEIYGTIDTYLENSESSEVADPACIISQDCAEKDAPQCESQSSLSVSSSPNSPTHLSHDDLDESRDSLFLPAHDNELKVSLPEKHRVIETEKLIPNVFSENVSISHDDKEEWTVENAGELQEQEEYDELVEGYDEEDEGNEGVEDHSAQFDCEGSVEHLGKCGDEFEKSLGSHPDIVGREGESLSSNVVGNNGWLNETPDNILETEKALQDLSIREVNDLPNSRASIYSTLKPMETEPSSTVKPLISSVYDQSEPIKFQFGLFSSPPLIPSPVPSIQIGSIQLPLHLPNQGQSSFFQFGQKNFPSPISHNYVNHNPDALHDQVLKEPSLHKTNGIDHLPPVTADIQLKSITKFLGLSKGNSGTSQNMFGSKDSSNYSKIALSDSCKNELESMKVKDQSHKVITPRRNNFPQSGSKGRQEQIQTDKVRSPFPSNKKLLTVSKAPGPTLSIRGKKFIYTIKNSSSGQGLLPSDAPISNFRVNYKRNRQNSQRIEFRVKESVNRGQSDYLVPASFSGLHDKSKVNAGQYRISKRTGVKREEPLNKSTKPFNESEAIGYSNASFVDSQSSSQINVERLKLNNIEEDIDAPIQSGIVHVFRQPGIQVLSDEDDFIQVRSKRQMLNDKREQREKEIKVRSIVMKQARKPRFASQRNVILSKSQVQTSASSTQKQKVLSDSEKANAEGLIGLAPVTGSPSLSAMGTLSPAISVQSDEVPLETRSLPPSSRCVIFSKGQTDYGSNVTLEHTNQQVMDLTQSQLDEAMKTAKFETHASIDSLCNTTLESNNLHASTVANNISFSTSSNPINSLLSWEKIQFDAVTSPSILSSVDCSGSKTEVDAKNGECTGSFDRKKHLDESRVDEAEVAASAVATAAISNEEQVLDDINSENLGNSNVNELISDKSSHLQVINQTNGEDSLSVSLPADLSLETPPISLWSSAPTSQSSPSQIHTCLSGAQSFPCYEINPLFGGPVVTFGNSEESVTNQPQSQRSNMSGSRSIGSWPQSHTMDSFYGSTTGFTGPFFGPQGGIHGVQGHPHMVVYNHFSPVGQFGQVGLSFLGTSYIPSVNQSDWKDPPVSSVTGTSKGDVDSLNMVSSHQNISNVSPIHHIPPNSPLLPIASPFTMYDMFGFQSATEVPVQPRWSHSLPPHHSMSVPVSQVEIAPASLSNHSLSLGPSPGNRLHEVQTSTQPDTNIIFSSRSEHSISKFPNESGLIDQSNMSNVHISSSAPTCGTTNISGKGYNAGKNSSRGTVASGGDSDHINDLIGRNRGNISPELKNKDVHLPNPIGYGDQKGGISHRTGPSTGSEWHRRVGRNTNFGTEKNFASSKVKQIYVAKPSSTVSNTTA